MAKPIKKTKKKMLENPELKKLRKKQLSPYEKQMSSIGKYGYNYDR